ncbi:hypothetical protein [Streptomyces sp. NPDC047315]|uniref:hypothetical protein n=1 Tax=Streptomyces sp. NPDC047315 TaxID=3155142 RepID=UPI00340B381C
MTDFTAAPEMSALAHQPTAAAYRKLRRRRVHWLVGSAGLPVAVVSLATLATDPNTALPLLIAVVFIAPVPVLLAASALTLTPRTARILASYTWQCYPCQYALPHQSRQYAVAIEVAPGQYEHLQTVPYRRSLRARRDPQSGAIWFAGDPHAGGVISPVGGQQAIRVVNTRLWEPGAPRSTSDVDVDAIVVAERAGLAKQGRYVRRWF